MLSMVNMIKIGNYHNIRRNSILGSFAIVIIMYYFFTIFIPRFFPPESIACYRIKGLPSLPDIVKENPPRGKSIFFHETSCNSHALGKIIITARQACAVESAARMNPNFIVHLLFTSPGKIIDEGTLSDRILKNLQNYQNIRILHLDYESYTKNTPLENLYNEKKVESSSYSRSHASDVLRYLTLWKYGGIYLDLDVIVIKSLEDLPPNYAGSESKENVAAGVLNFESNGNGHKLAQLCAEDLRDNFRGNDWGYNGPMVITRLLQDICKAETAVEMINKSCKGFTVYPPSAFYLVPWQNWTMFFDPAYNDKLLEMSRNSYIMHVWNKHSERTKIHVKSDVPYSIFAKQYCPKVFSECDEYF